ncbi:MAG: cyclic nucleotide-binding domain-containing protein [Alphaproteobacteria bacterium]|nr:cyclic nucleotide-binding domain-containing protein [Alphaproteobacteria bacterium]
MNKGADVLERNVLPEGKVFIKAGEENCRAYVIQAGEVICYTMKGEERINVGRYGPGTLIGEACLMLDEPIALNYEAATSVTVVTITRQDFQKRLARIDKSIRNILERAMQKLQEYERVEMDKALTLYDVDAGALKFVKGLVAGLPDNKRAEYESVLLPHIDGLIKGVKALKDEKKSQKAG